MVLVWVWAYIQNCEHMKVKSCMYANILMLKFIDDRVFISIARPPFRELRLGHSRSHVNDVSRLIS